MRFLARCFLPIFAVWLCLFPAMAYAVPNTFRMGSTFYSKNASGYGLAALDLTTLAVIGTANPWVAAVVIGYQVGKLVLNTVDANNVAGAVNILPSGVAQSINISQNPTWTLDANGNALPPSVAPVINASYVITSAVLAPLASISGGSVAEVCVSAVAAQNSGTWYPAGYKPIVLTSTTATQCLIAFAGSNGTMTFTPVLTAASCPAGYLLNAGVCGLSNPALVPYPSDGVPTYQVKADGTGFQLDTRDPDTVNAPTTTNPIKIKGFDSALNPIQISISALSGGGMSVETFQQKLLPDGSMVTYRQKVTTGSDGKVVDNTSGTYPGSIEQQAGSLPIAPSSSSAPANMPTDYNREATQLQIKNNLDVIKTDLDPAQIPVDVAGTDIAVLDAAKAGRDAFKTDIDALSSAASPSPVATLFQPFTPSACQPLSWTYGSANTMGSHVYTLDLCPWVPTIQRVGAWAMYLLTAAMLFQMFTRRPEGGGD